MSSVTTTPRRMETFARALDRAAASAIVPRSRIDQLRSAFIATDAQGRPWTIDPEFQRWGRLDGELWMVDDPPSELFMDWELRASLEEIEAMAARAIVKGVDAHAPRTPWFRTPVAPAEPGMPASIPSRESAPPPPPPLDREPAPRAEPARFAEPAQSAEPMTLRPSASQETPQPARPAMEDPVVEPSVSSRVAVQAATPVEKPAPSWSAIPEAHRRFAGPGLAPAVDDALTPARVAMARDETTATDRMPASPRVPSAMPPRDAIHAPQRWVPTSIAPRLMAEHSETHDDRAHVMLCGLLAGLFLLLASWTGDVRGYAAALVFGLLTVTLLVLNLGEHRHD